MGFFNRSKEREYIENDDNFVLDYDNDEDDAPIERFSGSASRSSSAAAPSYSAPARPSYSAPLERPSYTPPRPSYVPHQPQPQSRPSFTPPAAPPSTFYRVEPERPRRRVEELFIAKVNQSNDAMAVANLVKEKKYALIIDLNSLKSSNAPEEYISVINFIDGVCYVTDSEFKEIVDNSGIYLIYHKDIVLNEGLAGYGRPASLKL